MSVGTTRLKDALPVTATIPDPSHMEGSAAERARNAPDYMGLTAGRKITDIAVDRVFIGSCTNGRIEDLREVAKVVEGKTVASTVSAMIVPGSGLVKRRAAPHLYRRRARLGRIGLFDVWR